MKIESVKPWPADTNIVIAKAPQTTTMQAVAILLHEKYGYKKLKDGKHRISFDVTVDNDGDSVYLHSGLTVTHVKEVELNE